MFAVIAQGGKQYRVETGDVLQIERIPSLGTTEKNQSIVLEDVRVVGEGDDVTLGTPSVAGASVKATVIREMRAPKIRVFVKKKRKHYSKQRGHRQNLIEVRVDEIARG